MCIRDRYIGSHDGRFPVTGVIAETSGDESKPWMGFAFRKHERIRPGAHWNTGIYCVTVSCRDWHYGAEIYREYIDPLLEIQPEPAFLQDEAALHQCYNFKHSGKITRRFADIPAVYEKGAEWGVRHMFMASWNRTGFDSSYPEYYPDMEPVSYTHLDVYKRQACDSHLLDALQCRGGCADG